MRKEVKRSMEPIHTENQLQEDVPYILLLTLPGKWMFVSIRARHIPGIKFTSPAYSLQWSCPHLCHCYLWYWTLRLQLKKVSGFCASSVAAGYCLIWLFPRAWNMRGSHSLSEYPFKKSHCTPHVMGKPEGQAELAEERRPVTTKPMSSLKLRRLT